MKQVVLQAAEGGYFGIHLVFAGDNAHDNAQLADRNDMNGDAS